MRNKFVGLDSTNTQGGYYGGSGSGSGGGGYGGSGGGGGGGGNSKFQGYGNDSYNDSYSSGGGSNGGNTGRYGGSGGGGGGGSYNSDRPSRYGDEATSPSQSSYNSSYNDNDSYGKKGDTAEAVSSALAAPEVKKSSGGGKLKVSIKANKTAPAAPVAGKTLIIRSFLIHKKNSPLIVYPLPTSSKKKLS